MLKYREFLETLVAENQRDYTDIDDVTGKRYPTLLHAYEQLLEAERLAVADVEAKTEELKSLESQRQNAVLTKTSQVCVCVRACVCVCVLYKTHSVTHTHILSVFLAQVAELQNRLEECKLQNIQVLSLFL